jgi:hypothetical protein
LIPLFLELPKIGTERVQDICIFLFLEIKVPLREYQGIATVVGKEVIFDKRQDLTFPARIAVIVREGAADLVLSRPLEMLDVKRAITHDISLEDGVSLA